MFCFFFFCFFFQAEDGIRDAQESRGLGDVYKRQIMKLYKDHGHLPRHYMRRHTVDEIINEIDYLLTHYKRCLLYTSDAADDLLCVDLGGRRIIKKKNQQTYNTRHHRQ